MIVEFVTEIYTETGTICFEIWQSSSFGNSGETDVRNITVGDTGTNLIDCK